MKLYTLKIYLVALGLTCLIPAMNAQFDDVYYDPDTDLTVYHSNNTIDAADQEYSAEDDVTYYDNDEYEYYDDYDYYYSSRIKRFYRPSFGSGFYDPYYVDSYYYDPYYSDSYYYPGSTIYLSFGNSNYWNYRHWRRWNRWNSYNPFNNWCLTPYNYYYSYNSWCSPHHNYWGGYNGYYTYSNYYNNYYNSCPFPVSNYYGITHTTVTNINSGSTRGSYYGPRITGNTGSSPRGPIDRPGIVQPVFEGNTSGLTQNNDKTREVQKGSDPIRINPQSPVESGIDRTPGALPTGKEVNSPVEGKEIPVDKEIRRESTPQRPVFRPETDKFKPYPTSDRTDPAPDRPTTDKPSERSSSPQTNPASPSGENYKPYSPPERSDNPPTREEPKPSYTPGSRENNERPSYSPPRRNDDAPSNDRPSYSPPSRPEGNRSNDRPSYSPPPRNNDTGRSNDAGRSNDRPSYSPSSNRSSSSGGASGGSQSSRGSSSSSSGSSPRSSGRGN